MSSLLTANLGMVVTGDWRHPLRQASSIYIEEGRIAEIPSLRSDADTITDARGLIARGDHSNTAPAGYEQPFV